MNNTFYFSYAGNKRKEVEVIYNMIESKINENSNLFRLFSKYLFILILMIKKK